MSSHGRPEKFALALDSIFLGSSVALARANRKLLAKVESASPEQYVDDPRLRHDLTVLTAAREESIRRVQRIEDKAKGTVLGVGIAVTVIGAASAALSSDGPLASANDVGRFVVAVLLFVAVAFLLLSGYFALEAYAVGSIYAPTLEDVPPLAPPARARLVEIYSLEQNQRIGTIRGNYTSASFASLRNGIVLLAMIGLAFVLMAFLSGSRTTTAPIPMDPCGAVQCRCVSGNHGWLHRRQTGAQGPRPWPRSKPSTRWESVDEPGMPRSHRFRLEEWREPGGTLKSGGSWPRGWSTSAPPEPALGSQPE